MIDPTVVVELTFDYMKVHQGDYPSILVLHPSNRADLLCREDSRIHYNVYGELYMGLKFELIYDIEKLDKPEVK